MVADDIMVIGKKQNHRDHDLALTAILETARKYSLTELQQTPIQRNRSKLLCRNIHDQQMQTSTNESICNNMNAITKLQEAGTIFYRNGQLPIQIFHYTFRTSQTY